MVVNAYCGNQQQLVADFPFVLKIYGSSFGGYLRGGLALAVNGYIMLVSAASLQMGAVHDILFVFGTEGQGIVVIHFVGILAFDNELLIIVLVKVYELIGIGVQIFIPGGIVLAQLAEIGAEIIIMLTVLAVIA